MIVGAIECIDVGEEHYPSQLKEIRAIVETFPFVKLHRQLFHIVPPQSDATYNGGIKVSFTLFPQKSPWEPRIRGGYIEELEDLMNALPFDNAVLFSNDAVSCMIEWLPKEWIDGILFEDDDKRRAFMAHYEPSKYPHIYRTAYGHIYDFPQCKPSGTYIVHA